jgi:Type I phosphodiesterase / nucleotide pyrophosphatase
VILTGSYPNRHGIVANSWFDASQRKSVYCVADTLAPLIGTGGEGRSPRSLLDSTVGDRLKRVNGSGSRIIAIAGKDRSAILMGGHLADAAYWTEDTLFVSSSYYLKDLPDWVKRFNTSGAITRYWGRSWNRLLPQRAYAAVGRDDVSAEENPAGMGRTFPHRLSTRRSTTRAFITAFQTSPFENEVLVDFAIDAVTHEQLGLDQNPDLLAIGFSANDLVGHSYGPDSHEVMDITLRTDRQLERLLNFLDRRVGLDSVIVTLTSDHGVAPLPELVRRRNPPIPAARLDPKLIEAAAEGALRARFGAPRGPGWMVQPSWIMSHIPPSLYLNEFGLQDREISLEEAERIAQAAIKDVPGVERAITATELLDQRRRRAHSSEELGFYPGRSGHIYYELSPYVVPGAKPEGTTHGSPWAYDTQVALVWWGPGIGPGTHAERVSIADVAPTLAVLLGIQERSGDPGRVLREMLR